MIWQVMSSIGVACRSKDRLMLRAAGVATKSGFVPQNQPVHMSKYHLELNWSDADGCRTNVRVSSGTTWSCDPIPHARMSQNVRSVMPAPAQHHKATKHTVPYSAAAAGGRYVNQQTDTISVPGDFASRHADSPHSRS